MTGTRFNPIRRILVPTDFSPNAAGAVNYAVAMASRLGSRVLLFHSIRVPVVTLAESAGLVSDERLVRDAQAQLRLIKEELKRKYPAVEVDVNTTVGFAVDEIIGMCKERLTDLIVMGTRGAHGLGEMLMGSNTAEVITRAHCPVLAVPEAASLKDIRRILFATNYADNDFQSLFLLTEIFKDWNPEIFVVHAEEGRNERAENRQFEWFKGQVMTSISYDRFAFHLIDGSKSPEHAVSDFASRNDVDLISVSTRRKNLFEKVVSRSVSRKLAYHTHIPLLAFHTDATDGSPAS